MTLIIDLINNYVNYNKKIRKKINKKNLIVNKEKEKYLLFYGEFLMFSSLIIKKLSKNVGDLRSK